MNSRWVLILLVVFGLIWLWRRSRMIRTEDGMNITRADDRDMERAINAARENFQLFVDRLNNPQAGDENFSIKVAIAHNDGHEHIWLSDVEVDGNNISGTIGNEPRFAPFKLGELWRGTLAQLSDWVYMSHGLMQGNFTLRAMLPRMPRKQREQARRMLEERWDTRELAHLPWPRNAAMPGAIASDALSTGDPVLMDGVSIHPGHP